MSQDQELIRQSYQTVKLLSEQLKLLKQSRNVFLAEMVMALLDQAAEMDLRLERLGRLSEKQT